MNCPVCNSPGAYQGLGTIECLNPSCRCFVPSKQPNSVTNSPTNSGIKLERVQPDYTKGIENQEYAYTHKQLRGYVYVWHDRKTMLVICIEYLHTLSLFSGHVPSQDYPEIHNLFVQEFGERAYNPALGQRHIGASKLTISTEQAHEFAQKVFQALKNGLV